MSTDNSIYHARQIFEKTAELELLTDQIKQHALDFVNKLESEKTAAAEEIQGIKNRLDALEGKGQPIPAPDESPIPSPEPTPTPTPPATEAPDPFQKGTVYQQESVVQLPTDFTVPVETTTVVVPVTLDRESANTVIAYLRCMNDQGIDYGRVKKDFTQAVVFQPGGTEKNY